MEKCQYSERERQIMKGIILILNTSTARDTELFKTFKDEEIL